MLAGAELESWVLPPELTALEEKLDPGKVTPFHDGELLVTSVGRTSDIGIGSLVVD